MNVYPWMPVMELSIIFGSLPVVWWAAIDRQRWLLIRAYRRHREDVDARRHVEWARRLLHG